MIYDLPIDGSINITLPYTTGCYILTINHSYAGSNIYIVEGYYEATSVRIYSLHESYSKYTITSVSKETITVSQKDTGGNSRVGLLRIA